MTVLCDSSIRYYCTSETLLIQPYNQEQLQPASYDLLLGLVRLNGQNLERVKIRPGEFLLASTLEKVHLPASMVGRIEGKSSRARQGLIIHTAGFIDPGFEGELTLEITNLSNKEIPLERGMRIGQIAFQW